MKITNYPRPISTICNILKYWLMTMLLVAGMMTNLNAATYYSQSGGFLDLNTLANWNTIRLGGGATPGDLITPGDIFVIQGTGNGGTSPHAVTTTAIVTIGAAGSKLQIENGASLKSDFAVTIVSGTTFQVDNGGTYFHNNTVAASTSIFAGTESFGATSTTEIDNWAATTPILTTGVGSSFGHLIMNLPAGWTNNWNQSWNATFTLCQGNFTVSSTGTGSFRMTGTGSFNVTIGGNYSQSAGTVVVTQNASGTPTLNVNGGFSLSGGNFISCNGGGSSTVNVSGNYTQTGGNNALVNAAAGTALFAITGSFSISSGTCNVTTGTGTGTGTLNVSTNFTISGGTVNLNNTGSTNSGNANVNVTGNYNQTAGTLSMNKSGVGTATFTVTGNTTINTTTGGIVMQTVNGGLSIFQTQDLIIPSTGTSTALVDFGTNATPSANEFRIKGNFSKAASSGAFYTTAVNPAKGFVFNGTGTLGSPQTFSYAGTNSDYCSYTVNSGTVVQLTTGLVMGAFTNPYSLFTVNGTLDCGTNVLSGGNATVAAANTGFTLASGGTLITKRAGGVTATITDLTTNYNAAANYTFNGTATQNTNFAAAGQNMNNLTIDNSGGSTGVTLNNTATVNGTITVTTGTFTIGSALTMGASAATTDNAAIVLNTGITWNCGGTQVSGTGTVTINGTFITTRAGGFNGSASSAIMNTISSLTLATTSTVDYARTNTQTITAANYGNLTNSGNAARTFISAGTIGIATSFTPGSGLYTIGTSTVNYNGSPNITIPIPSVSSGGNYYNLQFTGSANYTLAAPLIVANDVTVNGSGGNFRVSNGATNTLTVNGNVSVQVGTFTGNTTAGTGLATINILGNFSQTGGNVNLNNSSAANAGTASLNITGTYNQTGGTFNLIGNGGGTATATIGGTVTVNTSGTDGIYLESGSSTANAAIFQANSDVTFSGASTSLVDFGTGSLAGNEFRVKGNFSKSGTGSFTTTSTNTVGATGFVFNGTGTLASPQTFSYSGTNSDKCSYQVNSGTAVHMLTNLVMGSLTNPYSVFTLIGTLDCDLNVLSGGLAGGGSSNTGFFVAIGGTVATKNTGGILGTITYAKTSYSAAANYIFNGTANQSSAFKSNPQQMANLTISNPNGVTLAGSATITGTLAFTSGIITTGANAVSLNSGATVTGAGPTAYVDGNVLCVMPPGTSTVLFPFGSSSAYAPVTLTMNGAAGQVFIAGTTLTGPAPNENSPIANSSGIDQTKKSGNYWTMIKSGTGTFSTYDISFTIAYTANTGTPTNYVVRKFDSPLWATTTLGTQTSSVTQATGLTGFSEFEVGEANPAPTVSAPTPATQTFCEGTSASFTVTATGAPAVSYQWRRGVTNLIDGGASNISGATTATLTIGNIQPGDAASNYNCVVSNINNPSVVSADAELVVNTLSAAPTGITGTTTICNGGSTSLTRVGGFAGTGAIREWFEGSCGSTVIATGNTINVSPTVTTTYFVRFNGTCNTTTCASTTVTVDTLISNTFITSVSGVTSAGACDGDVFQVTANSASVPGVTYEWTTDTNTSVVLFSASNGGPWSAGPFVTSTNQVWAQFGTLGGTYSGYTVAVKAINACGSTITFFHPWIRGKVSGPGLITPADPIACPNNVKFYTCGSSTGATVYTWTLSGSQTPITSGQGTTSATVTFPPSFVSGQLCVTAALSCGLSSVSPPRCMTISNTPAKPGVITGASKVCPGETGVPFSIPAVSGATGYNWTVPAGCTIASGTNTPSITVDFPAIYTGTPSLCVTANSSCAASEVRCKTVGSQVPGMPGNITGSASNICNLTVQYSVPLVSGLTYTWSVPTGTTINSGQGSNILTLNIGPAFTSGQLSVVANNAACTPPVSGLARTISITGKPSTPPAITANPVSWCAGGSVNFSVPAIIPSPSYNWFVATGTIANGQGSNSINVTWGSGAGNVNVTASNACGSSGTRSQSFSSSCREEGTSASDNFTVYPNPAHDNVTVSIYVNETTGFVIQLRDVSGRTVFSQNTIGAEGLNTFDLDLSRLSKGVYMLDVKSASNSWIKKVVVE